MKEKFSLVLSTIQTIILILILVILLTDKKQSEAKQMTAQLEAHYRNTEPLKIADTDAIWGNKDAPTTLIAFIDYECPYCKDLYKNIKEIEQDYITTGKVKVIFRDMPLKMHKHAKHLAAVMECARKQGKFWDMADKILTSKEKFDSTMLTNWATELNLSLEKIEACATDNKTLDAVKADVKDARSRHLTGTPAVFINNAFYRGTIPASDLRDIFEGKKVVRAQKSGSCFQR